MFFFAEAYGPGRMGSLMSSSLLRKTLIQRRSPGFRSNRFSQYAYYLYPLGPNGQTAVSGALVFSW